MTACLIMCLVALPIGLLMERPVVWGLALLGIAVASIKLRAMRREDAAAKHRLNPSGKGVRSPADSLAERYRETI